MYRVELSKRALRDLRRMDHKGRRRLLDMIENELAAEPQPANLDVKPLTGRAPLAARPPWRVPRPLSAPHE
jgi:mRNA-degrading endonuclease RelE of RelBE toxin-antitoxin system